jgi:surfactin synthase thioesterase subunit
MCDVYLEHLPQHVFDQALLVGHSLGGYVAFAMAQRLERLGRPAAGVIISGARPPHRRDPERPLAPMPRPELFDWLSRLGGLPGEPNDQRAFFELYEESIRADLRAFDGFDPGAWRLERTPLRAVGATRDPLAPAAEFPEWARYAATASTTIVEGEHLFVVDAPGLTADAVVPFVDALPRPAPAAAPLEVGP